MPPAVMQGKPKGSSVPAGLGGGAEGLAHLLLLPSQTWPNLELFARVRSSPA